LRRRWANTPDLQQHSASRTGLGMNDFPLLGNPGEAVPTVDVADLIAVWNIGQEVSAPHPGQTWGVDIEICKSVCQPGADVRAIWFRLMMTHAVGMMGHEELT